MLQVHIHIYLFLMIEKQNEEKGDFYIWKDDLLNREEPQHKIVAFLSHIVGFTFSDAVYKAKYKVKTYLSWSK